ncbi:MAG: oligosaccharide flippase family protein [Candidatus Omnitrophica bacterium]|nr:oligosaccharide flippase family protein [Candidatus Omnitrophota bacterium]
MSNKIKFGIVGHTLLGFGTDIVTYGFAFLASIVVARALGPVGRGAFAIITMLNQYLVSMLQFGMGAVAEMQLAKKEYSLRAVHSFTILFSVLAGIFAWLLFLILSPWLFQSFLRNMDRRFCWMAVGLVPLVLYSLLGGKILVGMNEIPALNLFKIIRGFWNLSGFVLLVLVFPLGLTGAVSVWMVETIFLAVLQGWWFFKLSGWRLELSPRIIRESCSFGWKVHFAFLPAAAIMQLDSFVLNFFNGPQSVGLYTIANNVAFRISFLFNSMLTAAQASVIGRAEADSKKLVRRLIRHSVFAAGMIAIFLCLTGPFWMLWFYGKAFVPSAGPLAILSFGVIAITVTNFLSVYVVGQLRKTRFSALVNWGSFFLGLCLYFFLVPRFGLLGVAWASLLISIARVIGYLWLLRWVSLPSISETFILRLEDFIFWRKKIHSFWERWAVRSSVV